MEDATLVLLRVENDGSQSIDRDDYTGPEPHGLTAVSPAQRTGARDVRAPLLGDVGGLGGAAVLAGRTGPNRAAGPKNPRIITSNLTDSTRLTWLRGPEPDLAGYEVVLRERTSPQWTHVLPVGDVTTHEVDLLKDNVFFGVRAVNRSGPRGPVAFPSPRS